VTLFGWEGNRRPGGELWQPTAVWMLNSHTRADSPYTGISSGPSARKPLRGKLLTCFAYFLTYFDKSSGYFAIGILQFGG